MRDGGIIRGPASEKKIALVFSGHSFAEGGQTILDELARHKARASFFFTGDFLSNTNFAAPVRRIIAGGHYLGPHSDKHLLYCGWDKQKTTLVTRDEFRADLNANLQKIEHLGVSRSDIRFFLPAYEQYNHDIATWSGEMGLTLIDFTPGTRANADYTGEADKNFVSSQVVFDSILKKEREDPHGLNGFILLLHIGSGPGRLDKFSARFGGLLDYLSEKGYQFVRVDELFKKEEIFIRANQIGYQTSEPKVAIAFSKSPLPLRFSVVTTNNGIIFQGNAEPITNATWGQFKYHSALDFSPVHKSGRFVLKIGESKSLPLFIGNTPCKNLPDELLEFMRQQRCGILCHLRDGRTAYGPRTNGTPIDVTGGWHDAGDMLKYLVTSEDATAEMLLACTFDHGSAALLDEARWGLDWMLKMHPAPDELYHQVADDRDHAGWRLPQNDEVDYDWGRGGARVVYFADGKPQGLGKYQSASTGVANLAGVYAAAMALSFEMWKDSQKDFAARCLQAGEEVYDLGRAREGVQQGNSYGAPYRYAPTIWAGDMEWGATELFRATGQTRYLADAKRYATLGASEGWMGQEQTGHYQYFPFINIGHYRLYDLVDHDFQNRLAGYYRDGIERCMHAGEKNPYDVGVPFIWCSDNLVVALVTQCLLYQRMTGDSRYENFAVKQRDWLLGRNPWGTTMFTEMGDVFPRDAHLMTVQLLKRPVRGGLVDGPVYERIFESLKGVTIRQPDPLAQFQGPAVYHDDGQDYSSNEPTLDGTASAILMFALCADSR